MNDLESTDIVEKAIEALDAFVSPDECKALARLSPDFHLRDRARLFAGDVRRLHGFLAAISSDQRRGFQMSPWSYDGSMLRFRVAFHAGCPRRVKFAEGGTSMSIWVDLSKDGRIREMDIRYRPETIITALSRGVPDRLFRILMYKAGFLRFVFASDLRS